MASSRIVGVLGSTSLVGGPLVAQLGAAGWRAIACSRASGARQAGHPSSTAGVCRPGDARPGGEPIVATWITLCPLWAVPEWLPWLESLGIRRLVAVSSTSVLTRRRSPDAAERRVAEALAAAEEAVGGWCAARGAAMSLLRPTLIYDGVTDGTIAAIAGFARRRGWFPVAGPARGLRQPVHAADVAAACVAAIAADDAAGCYTISGGTALPFRDLVAEVFIACGLAPRIVHVPRPIWAAALPVARALGIARDVSAGMAARMNDDLAFDHGPATRDLGFRPRPFTAAELARTPGFAGAARRRAVA
jgi:nucleoside-diphosphate-sugar epimerase